MHKIIIFATFYLIFCSHTESAAISFDGFNKSLVNSFNQTSQIETVVLERSLEDFQNLSASNSTREKRQFLSPFSFSPFGFRPVFSFQPKFGPQFNGEGSRFQGGDRSFDGRFQDRRFGEGSNRFGEGSNRFGEGSNRFGEGSNRFGEGSNRFDPERRFGNSDRQFEGRDRPFEGRDKNVIKIKTHKYSK